MEVVYLIGITRAVGTAGSGNSYKLGPGQRNTVAKFKLVWTQLVVAVQSEVIWRGGAIQLRDKVWMCGGGGKRVGREMASDDVRVPHLRRRAHDITAVSAASLGFAAWRCTRPRGCVTVSWIPSPACQPAAPAVALQ